MLWFRVAAAILCISIGLGCAVTAEEECLGSAFLICRECDNDEITVELRLGLQSGVCAMIAEIRYDEEGLLFLGGESMCALELTFADIGGRISFLLDGHENCNGDDALACFYFKRIGQGEHELELHSPRGENAVYINELGDIRPVKTELSGCSIGAYATDPPGEALICFSDFEIDDTDGGSIASFSVLAKGEFFAAGVRIFIVDLDSGGYEDVSVAGMVSEDGLFKCNYRISRNGRFSVIFTPLGYYRSGVVTGERRYEILVKKDK